MENIPVFKTADWPMSLKVVSCIGTLLICGISIAAIRVIPPHGFSHAFGTGVACIPPALLLGSLLFVVRSYTIQGGHLSIRRLLWSTNIPLLGIHDAQHDPQSIKGALKIFGNGGLFSITGLYSNKTLGKFRFFITDPSKSVIMRLNDRIIVISPEDSDAFLHELGRLFPRLATAASGTAIQTITYYTPYNSSTREAVPSHTTSSKYSDY